MEQKQIELHIDSVEIEIL